MKKETIIIIISMVIVAISLIFIVRKVNKRNDNVFIEANNLPQLEDIALSTTLFPVGKDKVTYIDNTGKVVLDLPYYSGTYFYGDIAEVYIDYNKNVGLINKEGNLIAKTTYGNFYEDKYGIYIVDGNLYYKKENKINSDNQHVYPFGSYTMGSYMDDFGVFGYTDSNSNENGLINYKGDILYKVNSKSRIELDYDKDTNTNYMNFPNKYCVIGYDGKSGIIDCDSGKEIIKPTSEYKYKVLGCNVFGSYKNDEHVESFYIYKDKIAHKFNKEIYEDVATCDSEKNYIGFDYGDRMLLDGTFIKSMNQEINDERFIYNKYRFANYLLDGKFEIVNKTFEERSETSYASYTKYGIKKDNNIVIPIEYDEFYFDVDNEKYVIAFKEENNEYYLYDLDDPENYVVKNNDDMGFYSKNIIYIESESDKTLKNLDTQKELKVLKDDSVSIFDSFIKVRSNTTKVYDKDFKLIYEY